MSRDFRSKVKKAAAMLLYRGFRRRGVMGWELRKYIGKDYVDVLRDLNEELDLLGLTIKAVSDSGDELDWNDETMLRKAYFVVVLKNPPPFSIVKTAGWRIDDLAILAATLMYIVSKRGKANRNDVERFLCEKFPKWKVEQNLDRFIKLGYLREEGEVLHIGWRTKVEVNLKKLLGLPE